MIANALARLIEQQALEGYPNEICGFVIDGTVNGRDIDGELLPLPNIHPDPEKSFRIDPKLFLEYEGRITAVYHSHPDAPSAPSEADMRYQMALGIPFIIVATNGTNCIAPFEFGSEMEPWPLEGRPFRHGVTDCMASIRDWYRLKTDIRIAECPREWNWWKSGGNLYEDNYKLEGFRKLDEEAGEEPQPHDAFFICANSKVPNHGGIYVGEGLIYHHMGSVRDGPYSPSHLSVIEYGLRWRAYRPIFVRHRSLDK